LPRKVLGIGILLLLVNSGHLLRAQIIPEGRWWQPGSVTSLPILDSLLRNDSQTLLGVDFQHTLSLFSWSSSVHMTSSTFIATGPLTPSFSLNSEARSRLREDTRIRTSEANALIDADYPLDDERNGFTVSFFGTTYTLSGSPAGSLAQLGTLRNVSDGYGVLGGKYFPYPFIELTAGGGIAHKSFEIGTSSGTIFKAGMIQSPVSISEGNTLESNIEADERHFRLADEVARNDNAHAHLITTFSESGFNDAIGGMYLKRRDFFFPKDTSGTLAKQERNELGFELHDALFVPIVSKRLLGNFRFDFSPHDVTRRTPSVDITSLPTTTLTSSTFLVPSTTSASDASVSARLDYLIGENIDTSRLTQLSAEMRYDEKSETNNIIPGETGSLNAADVRKLTNALDATSFDGRQTSLNLSTYIPFSERDALRADFTARIYRYDTPSLDNHDDRDELNLAGSIQYLHNFTLQFALSNELRLTKNHLVYLESDRSLQNYTSSTISFISQTLYRSPSFQHQLRAEVFANYSVYDFSAPIPDPTKIRDYLIRGINGSDSIQFAIGRSPLLRSMQSEIEGIFDLRLYERGAYNSAAFTERPILRTSEFTGELTFNLADIYSALPTLIKIGGRAFLLRRFSANPSSQITELLLQEKIDRIGPLFVIIIDESQTKGPRLYGSIWYSFVNQESLDTHVLTLSHQTEARLTAQWTF
jgi:hypothetical protein